MNNKMKKTIVYKILLIGGYIGYVFGIVNWMSKIITTTTHQQQQQQQLQTTRRRIINYQWLNKLYQHNNFFLNTATMTRRYSTPYNSNNVLLKGDEYYDQYDNSRNKILKNRYYIPDTSIQIQNLIKFLYEEECEGIDFLNNNDNYYNNNNNNHINSDNDKYNDYNDDIDELTTQIGLSIPNKIRGLYVSAISSVSYTPDDYIVAIPVITAFEIMQQSSSSRTSRGTSSTVDTTTTSTTESSVTESSSSSSIRSDVEKGIAYLLKRQEIENNQQHNNDDNSDNSNNKWGRYFQCLPTMTSNCDKTIDFWINNKNNENVKNHTNTVTDDDDDDDDDNTENDDNNIALQELQKFLPLLVTEAIERNTIIQQLSKQYNLHPNHVQFATWLVRSRMFTMIQTKSETSPSTTTTSTTDNNLNNNNNTTTTTNNNNNNNNNKNEIATGKDLSVQRIQRTMLIPYMDMINHATIDRANAIIQIIEGTTDDESMFCIQAIRIIKPGQEIIISYGTGQETTLDIFSKYGFLPLDRIGYMIRYNLNDKNYLDWDNDDDILLSASASVFEKEIMSLSSLQSQCLPSIKIIEQHDIQLLKSLLIGGATRTSSNRRIVVQLRIYLRRLYHNHRYRMKQQTNKHLLQTSDDNNENATAPGTTTKTTTIQDDNGNDPVMNEIQINLY
jgi:SET domain